MILEALSRSEGSGSDGDYHIAGGRTLGSNRDQVTALWGLGQEGVGGRGRAIIAALTSEAEAEADSTAALIGRQGAEVAGRIGGRRGVDGCDTGGASNDNTDSNTDSSVTGDDPSSGCTPVPLLSRQELLDMAFTTARGIHDAVCSCPTTLLCLLTLFNSLPIVYVSTYLVIADLLFLPSSLPQSLPPSFPRICHCPVPLSLSSSFTPYLPPDPTHNTHITHRAGRISDTGSTHPSHGRNRAVTGAWGTCVPWLCGRCNML